MAEYTPTTDEVRERFIDGAINRAKVTGFSVTLYIRNKAREDFDRWLAEVREGVLDALRPEYSDLIPIVRARIEKEADDGR